MSARRLPWSLFALVSLAACGKAPFPPQNELQGVRVLSSRTETPFAKPGEQVDIDLLVADARPDRSRPLVVGWIPVLCTNPTADVYAACFAGDAMGGGAGGMGGFDVASLAGTDITDFLTQGTRYSFTVPDDVIVSRPNIATDYGLIILFNIACAGRVRIAPLDAERGAQQMPILCVDEQGQQVSTDEYVVGFTRVYAYAERRNQNPVISSVSFQGQPIDLEQGIRVPRCTAERRIECDAVEIDVDVPAESQEPKEGERNDQGETPREQVWAAYYTTAGRFQQDIRLLYDNVSGLVTDRPAEYIPPPFATDGRMYVVVKDDRGGTSWVDFPLRVE